MNGWGGSRPATWRQPVGWGALHETPPVVTAPVVRESPADWLFNGILRPAWAYRLELALIGLVAVAYLWLGDRLGRAGAERLIVAAALVVAMVTWTREPLAYALFRSTCAGVGAGLPPCRAGHPQRPHPPDRPLSARPGRRAAPGPGSRRAARCRTWRPRPNASPPSSGSARSGWRGTRPAPATPR